MPPTPKPTVLEIETISEDAAQKHVRETYADPEGALGFFDGYIAQKEKALKAFHAAVGKDQELAAAFAKSPVATLQERGLLGPLDRLNIEGLPNPFQPLPWPFPLLPPPPRARMPVGEALGVRAHLRLPLVLARLPPPLQVGRPDPLPLLDDVELQG